jgi:hypothetical protein
VEIMGSHKVMWNRIAKSQSVLMMIHPILSTRTRTRTAVAGRGHALTPPRRRR